MTDFDLFTLPPLNRPAVAPKGRVIGTGRKLRWCQREDADALMYALESGHKSPCCIAATGYGKATFAAEIVGRTMGNGKVVLLVDRAHLVHQLANEIEYHLPRITCGRVADGACQRIHHQVVVSTVQAMYTPDKTGKPLCKYWQFDGTRTLILDESHKQFAAEFMAVGDYFRSLGAVSVFLTATPVPSSGAKWNSLVDWTPKVEGPCMRTVGWCVRNGYLVRPTQAFVRVDLDLDGIYRKLSDADPESVLDDDSDGDELSDLLVNLLRDKGEKAAASFAAGICDVIGDRQSIIFTPSNSKSAKKSPLELISSWITATNRIKCEPIWGTKVDKNDMLDRFKKGEPQALASVQLLCEGLNVPKVSAIFICRLLKQWRIVQQMIGRGLRPHPDCVAEINAYDEPNQEAERRNAIKNSPKVDCLVADLKGKDGQIYQQSALDVLHADESEDVRHEMGVLADKKPRPETEEAEDYDQELLDEARSELLRKQNEKLNELARKRAMAGELDANVTVTYGSGEQLNLPQTPMPLQKATEGEAARFLAHAVANGMSVESAMHHAATKPRQVIRGWTNSEARKLGDKKPNWNAARRSYPNWAANKGKK